VYIDAAKKRAESKFGARVPDFSPAAERRAFRGSGRYDSGQAENPPADLKRLNRALRDAESALLFLKVAEPAVVSPCDLRSGQYTGSRVVIQV